MTLDQHVGKHLVVWHRRSTFSATWKLSRTQGWLLCFFFLPVEVLVDIMTFSSCCFWKYCSNSGHSHYIISCCKFWGDSYILICTHCQELMKSMESMAASHCANVWYFVSEYHSQGYDHAQLSCACFVLARCDSIVSSKVFLWIFQCNLIDISSCQSSNLSGFSSIW
jgi:hypothetical protein